MKIFRNSRGYTLAEMLIALFITGLLATAGFQFYIKMHNSTLTQEQISEMQQSSRASLTEMSRILRMAGYKLAAHAPYRINGDSLYVFYRDSTAIDTILYFLQDYEVYELALPDTLDDSVRPKKLMKQVNSHFAQVFADNINDMSFTVVNPSTIEISLTVQPLKADEDLHSNSGFRTYTAVERVKLRNLGI